MEFQELIEVLESAEFVPQPYSGRSMYGRNCLGIACDNSNDVVLNIISTYLENCSVDSSSIQFAMDLCEILWVEVRLSIGL